jgi:hypothetical protein
VLRFEVVVNPRSNKRLTKPEKPIKTSQPTLKDQRESNRAVEEELRIGRKFMKEYREVFQKLAKN